MYSKLCIKCKNKSFSSCKRGKWVCPYCRKDLSGVKVGENKGGIK
ncbi:MAG: hypothetical protein ACOCP8_03645 [archaeon]